MKRLPFHDLKQIDDLLALQARIEAVMVSVGETELGNAVLEMVLETMQSKTGVICFLKENDDLDCPTMSSRSKDGSKTVFKGVMLSNKDWKDTFFGPVISECRSCIDNHSITVPVGHIPIERALGVPLIFIGKAIGIIAVGNKSEAYTENDRKMLEVIAEFTSPIFQARLSKAKSEQALIKSEAKYRALFDQAGDYILLLKGPDDRNLVIIDANKAAWEKHGYTREEFIGMPLSKIAKSLSEHPLPAHTEQMKTGRTMLFEDKHFKKDGTVFPVEISAKVFDNSDAVPTFLSIERDISDRKHSEKTKEKLQSQLTHVLALESVARLAGGVAHDFNNMLGVIIGNAEIGKMHLSPSDPLFSNFEEILKAAQRSADLTRKLLGFARKQVAAPRAIDLNLAISGFLKTLQRQVGENIPLAWVPGADLKRAKVDPAQMEQILLTLCANARDATSEAGNVTIKTENASFDEKYCAANVGFFPGKFVMISVTDSGKGIDPETLEHLFEPFFTIKEFGKSAGMGLSTIYGIVGQNGGFMKVFSRQGNGSEFRVYLPQFSDPQDEPVRHSTSSLESDSRFKTVLLVDDTPMVLSLTKQILEHLGYGVLSTSSPSEALHIVEKHAGEIRLLITDVVMPEMNGRELADRIKAIKPGMKCLFMSGHTADILADQKVQNEEVRFIAKPFTIKSLREKILEILALT